MTAGPEGAAGHEAPDGADGAAARGAPGAGGAGAGKDPHVAFVDLVAQDARHQHELEAAALRVLRGADYILGDDVEAFEQEFAAYCGSAHAVGVGSGLAAIELILRGYGIGQGDEVIVPAHTFVGTASAVTLVGATPVFADVGQDANLDPVSVRRLIGERTRAIIAVHLYGRVAPMDELGTIARERGLVLIEDAAQAHGAELDGRRAGTLGHAAAFSFYPSKNLGASGDAGMVTTDDGELVSRVRALRNCGQFEKNVHELLPLNHRMDTLQAAMLRVRLRALDDWNGARRRAAEWYFEDLADLDGGAITLPPRDDASRRSVWHLFVARSPRRDALRAALSDAGIPTGLHYPIAVHRQPYYEHRRDHARGPAGNVPTAEALAATVVSLPMHPTLDRDAVRAVSRAVRSACASLQEAAEAA